MRTLSIAFASLAFTSIVIGNAYYQKKQFYPSVVYITKSNPSMAVIYTQALILIVFLGKLMRAIFFGELRAAEFEHLIERSWYAITETCLAFTVFKDDFSPKFVALFTLLLFLKSFHWLIEDRVDFMERSPVISWLFHIRIVSLLSLLAAFDIYFVTAAYYHTVTIGASVQLVFGFEYAILLTVIFNISLKYILHTIDISRDIFWENKAVFLLHMELLIDFLKVSLYLLFTVLTIRLYTLPLFTFRPMYYEIRSFKRALHDVIMSRRAIRNMNTLYPDATPEELAAGDNVCIICREEMQTNTKKLPCNHIFHTSCLRSWFQRHQTCPTCRLNILRSPPDGQQRAPAPAAAAAPQAQGQAPQPFGHPWHHMLLPHFNMAPNIPNAGAHLPPQQQSSQSQQGTRPATYPTNIPNPGVPFPLMWPPMGFIPGMSNPPLPPGDWTGLSDEELRQMEENGRRGIESRLQCLHNINRLMDASVILMQQYINSSSVASAASFSSAESASDSNNNPSTSQVNATNNSSTSANEQPNVSENDEVREELSNENNNSKTSSENPNLAGNSCMPTTTQQSNNESREVSEQELIRRRRLEKLSNNNNSSTTNL